MTDSSAHEEHTRLTALPVRRDIVSPCFVTMPLPLVIQLDQRLGDWFEIKPLDPSSLAGPFFELAKWTVLSGQRLQGLMFLLLQRLCTEQRFDALLCADLLTKPRLALPLEPRVLVLLNLADSVALALLQLDEMALEIVLRRLLLRDDQRRHADDTARPRRSPS